jgi:hypothetical protein
MPQIGDGVDGGPAFFLSLGVGMCLTVDMPLDLRMFGLLALLGLSTACPGRTSDDGDDQGATVDASDTVSTSDDPTGTSSGTSSATSSATDPTDETSTSSPMTGPGSTDTGLATSDSTGEGTAVSYEECPSGRAAECPDADPLCVHEHGAGSSGGGGSYSEFFSFCTRACETDDDCATDLTGGTATSKCIEYDNAKICALDCAFGQSCPDGMSCEYGDACMWAHCNCSGDGCQYCP